MLDQLFTAPKFTNYIPLVYIASALYLFISIFLLLPLDDRLVARHLVWWK